MEVAAPVAVVRDTVLLRQAALVIHHLHHQAKATMAGKDIQIVHPFLLAAVVVVGQVLLVVIQVEQLVGLVEQVQLQQFQAHL